MIDEEAEDLACQLPLPAMSARDIPHSSRPSRRQRVDSVEGGLQLASRL